MGKKHEKYLMDLFETNNMVFTSSELIDILCENFKDCTRVNARKIIQNSTKKGIMKSTNPLTFGKNQYAYYSNNLSFSFNLVKDILKHNRPGLYRVLNRIEENQGLISYVEILKLSASPIKESKTKVVSFNELVSILKIGKIGDVREMSFEGVNYLVKNNINDAEAIEMMGKHNQKLIIDCIFITPLLIWLQKHNLINTKNGVIYRNKNNPGVAVIHNNLAWDAFAYTSTTGLYEFIGDDKEDKQTLVVLDFKIEGTYNLEDLHGFYDRIQIHRNSVKNKLNKRKVLPIVIANEISKQAYFELTKLNFLYFNLGVIFGERIYEVIKKLELTAFSNLFLSSQDEQETYLKQINDILTTLRETGQETNLQSLKGELFERIIYMVLCKIYHKEKISHSYVINKTYEDGTKRSHEYDFMIKTDEEFIAVEVKGYKGSTIIKKGNFIEEENKPEKDTIKWFFGYMYPFFKEKFNNDIFERPVKACYITTAQFDTDALQILENHNQSKDKPNKLDCYYNGQKLIELLKQYDMKKEIDVINQFYNPIL